MTRIPRGRSSRPRHLLPLALLPLFPLLAPACGAAPEVVEEVDDVTRARVIDAAGSVATELARTLSGELMAAVAEGGPEHAIDFCAREALVLTGGVAADLGPGWEVTRTALRVRNPANAADAADARALERFHAAEDAGEPLEDHVLMTANGDFRYYRPLRIAALCMECHGSLDAMQPGVRAAIAERYPDDDAVGYEEGELRGLIRVTVPALAVE